MARIIKDGGRTRRRMVDPLQLTALLYLKEALLKEDYESCPDIITLARQMGTHEAQIRYLLEDPRRSPG